MKTYEEQIYRVESQIRIMGNRMEELYRKRQNLMNHLLVKVARQQKERRMALREARDNMRADVRKSSDGFVVRIVTEPNPLECCGCGCNVI